MQARAHAAPGGPDVELLRLLGSTALQTRLDSIVGPKTLILTPNLAGPFGLVTEVGLLKVRALPLLPPPRSDETLTVSLRARQNNHAVTKMFWF